MTMLPRGASARLSLLAAMTAAVLVGFAPVRLHAAAASKLSLQFSDKPYDPDPQPLLLRPTVQQQLFVYIRNDADEDQKDLTVEVLADGAAVAATAQPFTAKGKKVTPVDFSKPAAAPPAPPAPAAPPAPKPPAPALEEAKGPLVVQIFDKDLKPIGDPQVLEVKPPSEYIEVDTGATKFDPGTGNGKNKLTVKVKTEAQFPGPVCRVELVLLPERIPGLQDSPRKAGTRAGYISKAKMNADGKVAASTLTLTAENLDLKPGAEGGSVSGLVYLTIDGWERAFTLQTTFPAKGDPTLPDSIPQPMVRLVASPFANPAAPYPVRLEADKIGNKVLELGLDRSGDMTFKEENNEIVKFTGDRRVHMLFSAAGPGGSLLVQPQVEDWKTDLDVTGIDGPRDLRVRVLNNEGKEVEFWGAAPPEFGKPVPVQPVDPRGALDKKLQFTFHLDGSEPQGIQLYFPDKPIKRGDPLKVQATTKDDPKDIKEVLFYLGKPDPKDPKGNPPPTVETVKGVRYEHENDKHEMEVVWAADLPAPTDTKGKVDVTAEFVKFNNLAKNGTATVTLQDAGAPGAPGPPAKPGSIAGVVFEAGRAVIDKDGKTTLTPDARRQQGIEVQLVDDKGAVKAAMKTDTEGKYLFKDVAAGSYKVTATKTIDSTAGQTAVIVVDGVDKTDVDIKLTR